ncbi:hypothetical protein [Sphingomonas sp. LY160]|uniref:hypothetical protein n=1 Tax=Sphingomonas sp. LY160 TaxID=3095342 RepID=UPI002ADEC63A|nr:hypothetical protein [Sphingomonas sp. LY160]MEA1072048.1 hypothetical protein [Sphingomonas sp. LY160]
MFKLTSLFAKEPVFALFPAAIFVCWSVASSAMLPRLAAVVWILYAGHEIALDADIVFEPDENVRPYAGYALGSVMLLSLLPFIDLLQSKLRDRSSSSGSPEDDLPGLGL